MRISKLISNWRDHTKLCQHIAVHLMKLGFARKGPFRITIHIKEEPPHENPRLFDPGQTTGVAVQHSNGIIRSADITNPQNIGKYIMMANEVVYENFTQHFGPSNLTPVKIIGIIEYLCEKHDVPYYKQEPNIKTFWSDEVLKHLAYTSVANHTRTTPAATYASADETISYPN